MRRFQFRKKQKTFLQGVEFTHAMQWRRKVPKSVCVCMCVCGGGGGGGGAHRHIIYVPSVKNQYKRVVFGYMAIY